MTEASDPPERPAAAEPPLEPASDPDSPAGASSDPASESEPVDSENASDGDADESALGAPARPSPNAIDPRTRPSFLFFGIASAVSLLADVGTKAWAEIELSRRVLELGPSLVLVPDHLTLTLAYNRGGAWGLLQDASDNVRKPFFLLVSILAIAFIVSLYSRLLPGQRALKWGLPLVLGGALGNLADRIVRSSVIDFIDFRADWIESMNAFIAKTVTGWTVTDHWPTFNVADISICVGVALMGVDMIGSRRRPEEGRAAPAPADEEPSKEAAAPSSASAPAPGSEAATAPTAEPR